MKKFLVSFFSVFIAITLVASSAGTGIAAAIECASPVATSPANGLSVVKESYQAWKATYVTSDGAGGNLRVQRSAGDNYDTVSEGVAYGMLFAAYNNDKPTFDGLWAYEQSYLNSNGFMNWRINANGTTAGFNGATDADEDIAAALVAADSRWGGYKAAATKQINLIKQFEVEQGTNVLKPGDVWGGSNLLDPSYLAPAYYDVFASYTGDTSWTNVKAASYKVLTAIKDNTDSKNTGLIPDWSTSSGAPAENMSYAYSYDASRAPLRLAMASSWSCDATAQSLLSTFNTTFQTKDLTNLASSYALNGTALSHDNSTPLLAAVAGGATTSSNAAYRTNAWNTLAATDSDGYYPDAMRLFGLLVASGVMINPLTLPASPVTTPAPVQNATTALKSSDSTVSTGTNVSLFSTVTVSSPKSNAIVDLELYDSTGKRVAQQVYENQSLTTAPKSYSLAWTPTTEGVYTLKGGLFTAGWASNMLWNESIAKVTVSKQVASTPTPIPVITTPTPVTSSNVSIWWPGSTQAVSGVQPFKAVFDGLELNAYTMYWQVDGGSLNAMYSADDGAAHKESLVNLSGWNWSFTNKYTINFVAKNLNGDVIGQKSTVITIYR